eukprot:scaffold2264_cov287-Pinguiococcus_pyrenoidosus.AAC.3
MHARSRPSARHPNPTAIPLGQPDDSPRLCESAAAAWKGSETELQLLKARRSWRPYVSFNRQELQRAHLNRYMTMT